MMKYVILLTALMLNSASASAYRYNNRFKQRGRTIALTGEERKMVANLNGFSFQLLRAASTGSGHVLSPFR